MTPDIFIITESRLKDFVKNTELTDNPNTYQIHRQDRKDKGGGGVLIMVKKEYFSEKREDMVAQSNLANEILPVEV